MNCEKPVKNETEEKAESEASGGDFGEALAIFAQCRGLAIEDDGTGLVLRPKADHG